MRESVGEAERERERIPSRLHAVSTELNAGLKLTNSCNQGLSRNQEWDTNQLSHPGVPDMGTFK